MWLLKPPQSISVVQPFPVALCMCPGHSLSITPHCYSPPCSALPHISLRHGNPSPLCHFPCLPTSPCTGLQPGPSPGQAPHTSKPWCPKAAQADVGNQCPWLLWRYSPMKEQIWGACSLMACSRVKPHTLSWVTGEHLALLSALPTVPYTNPQKGFLNGLGVSIIES